MSTDAPQIVDVEEVTDDDFAALTEAAEAAEQTAVDPLELSMRLLTDASMTVLAHKTGTAVRDKIALAQALATAANAIALRQQINLTLSLRQQAMHAQQPKTGLIVPDVIAQG